VTVPAILTRQARRDLARAVQRIDADNSDAADRMNDAMLDAARRLGANPRLGRIAPPPFLSSYRFWSLTRLGYLLVYDPATDPVETPPPLHAGRNLPCVLAELRGPPEL
jgi:plasmid stabilization system protein ParE